MEKCLEQEDATAIDWEKTKAKQGTWVVCMQIRVYFKEGMIKTRKSMVADAIREACNKEENLRIKGAVPKISLQPNPESQPLRAAAARLYEALESLKVNIHTSVKAQWGSPKAKYPVEMYDIRIAGAPVLLAKFSQAGGWVLFGPALQRLVPSEQRWDEAAFAARLK